MADEWERWGQWRFPDEQIKSAWAFHLRAARLLIDSLFVVSVEINPQVGGFGSIELGDLFGNLDEQAVEAAKAFMAERFAAAVLADDVRQESDAMVFTLVEEAEDAARQAGESLVDNDA